MGFDFGAFAGGVAHGVEQGIRMGKSIRDVIKERNKEEMLKKASAEAGAAYDAQQAAAGGLPSTPAEPPTPDAAAPAPEQATTYPVREQPPASAANPTDAGDPRTDPKPVPLTSPTASPDAAAAATASDSLAPAPAVKPTPQQIEAAAAAPAPAAPTSPAPAVTPQAAAASGMPGAAPAAPVAAAPVTQAKPDPAARADFIQKEMGKRAYDYFVSIGDLDTAEKWRAASETAGQRVIMRDWAKAYTAPDFDSMLDRFGKFYTDHVNDGVDYKRHEIVNRDGQQIGVITLKDRATGKEQKMELTQDKIMQLAEANNPAALFASESKRQALAAASRQKIQEKVADAKLKAQETVYKEDRMDQRERIKQEGVAARDERTGQRKLSEITLKSQLDAANLGNKARAEAETKIQMLKESGRTDEEIKALMPSILGVGDHKKTTDPAERRALIMSDLTKNDPTFGRLSEADKNKKVDESMRVVYGGTAGAPSAPAAGKPAAAPAAAPSAPVMVRDKKTGQIGRLEGGKFVPMQAAPAAPAAPAQAPAAQPAPATPAAAAATGLPAQPTAQAPAAPAARATLEQVLNPGGNASVGQAMAATAQSIRQAYGELAQLQEQTRQAAASGDQKAVAAAAQAQQVARSKLDALLKDMQPAMRNAVMTTLAQ